MSHGNQQLLYKCRQLNSARKIRSTWFFNNVANVKVRLSPSKKICVICLIESPLKMMKNTFYFILKALFVLKIFKFLPRLFGHVGKTA